MALKYDPILGKLRQKDTAEGGSATWGNIIGTLADQTDISGALGGKVDKVSGKGLSTNDFTDALKSNYDSAHTNEHTHANTVALAAVSGTNTGDQTLDGLGGVPTSRTVNSKVLSSNVTLTQDDVGDGTTYKQYSATEKSKLSGIADSANNYSLPTASADTLGGIKVGTRLTITDGVLAASAQTANDFTTDLKNKLDGIASGAEVNVNADWNASSGDAQILNKPILGTAATKNIPATGNASVSEVVYGSDTRLSDTRTPASHNNSAHSETYITASGVTYEALNANSDVGTGSSQVAVGNHSHSYEPANANIQSHISSTSNPHTTTGDQVLPTQTGNSGKYLKTDGSNCSWSSPPGGSEAFPVGAVFIAVVSTNPNTLLGYGTWSAFGAGKVLIGLDSGDTDFDTVEETGGAKTKAISAHADTAVSDHSAHTHSVTSNVAVANHTNVAVPGTATTAVKVGTSGTNAAAQTHTHTISTIAHSVTNNAVNSGNPSATLTHSVTQPSAHTDLNVVQPYIVVYMWKRTA